MTVDEILLLAREHAILLEARGDTLHVEGPAGVLTPTLRAELLRHKPALLVLLAPVPQFVCLKDGLTVPLPAVLLALDLEHRGFKMTLDGSRRFQIEPRAALTDEDRAGIRRWRLHLSAIVGSSYEVLA